LTALFLVMGLVAVLWYRRAGPRAHFAAVLLVLGLSLLVGLDQIIRIDQEHLGRVPVMLACLIFGIILVVLEFRTNKVAISQALRQSLIIGLCSGLTFFPWIVKNAIETGSSQPRKLLMGAEPGVPLDIGIIKELMEQ
jgi:UDP-N-acetylmuramyl pentapeptide phosphotransferase/UDP-N-acetylglucosamine-1-phosphate transferase